MKILIVDDNEVNRQLLQMVVEDCGHQHCEAENGKIACDKVKDDPEIDLVLMDINMPVMDGLEATRRIKTNFSDRLIPIVFVTALDDEETLAKCLAIGGDDFVPKPINDVILTAKLKAHSRTIEFYRELNSSHQKLDYHRRLVEREHNIIENIFNRCTSRMERNCNNVKYYMSPMSQFNGDILLVERSPLGGIYILLGDFTGHGLAAAIGCLPVSDIFFAMARKKASVGKIAREMNSKLREILPDNMFFCATLLELDSSGDRMAIWSGGMNDVVMVDSQQRLCGHIRAQHMPLGILDQSEFDEAIEVVTPFSGLKAYVYTDGLIEARNANDELFGEERLHAVLQNDMHDKIADLNMALLKFSAGMEQSDDIGIVEISGMPVSYSVEAACIAGSADNVTAVSGSVSDPLPWEIQLRLGHRQLKNGDTLQQILKLICSIQNADEHESIFFALLNELYSNALEHGLLELDSKIKTHDGGFEQYYQLREQKLQMLQDGEISLTIKILPEEPNKLQISLTDSGNGFDTQSVTVSLEQNANAYARGINLIESLCEQLHYTNNGRTVNVVYNLSN